VMGESGRLRVLQTFGWPAVAKATADLYEALLARVRNPPSL
jgi:hypothetical protein